MLGNTLGSIHERITLPIYPYSQQLISSDTDEDFGYKGDMDIANCIRLWERTALLSCNGSWMRVFFRQLGDLAFPSCTSAIACRADISSGPASSARQ